MKGVFKCAMEDDERRSWSVKRSSLGMPMCTPNKYSRRLKRLSLGMPPVHPLLHQQLSVRPSFHYIFITSCVMCYAWSVSLFTFFRFVFALFSVHKNLDPSFILCGRETRSSLTRTPHRICMLILLAVSC